MAAGPPSPGPEGFRDEEVPPDIVSRAALGLGCWGLLLGLWLLLIDRLDADELVAGGAAALIGTLAGVFACGPFVSLRSVRVTPGRAVRVPVRVVRDSMTVLWA